MTITSMHALVARRGSAIVERRAVPTPSPRGAIVRVTAASLCSADVACVRGDFAASEGVVLGHEAVGVVHALGDLVEGIRVDDRVAIPSTTPCGICRECQRGHGGHCRGAAWGGYSFGITRDGSLAEYVAVPAADYNLARIPDGLPDELALCATDSLLSGSTAPEAAGIPFGGVVVVFGQGHIGLSAIAGARALGAGLVVGVKARAGGDQAALAMGADLSLSLAEHDIHAEIARLTDGAGADCAIEATGVPTSFGTAVSATRLGGTIAVLNSYAGPADSFLAIPLAHWGWGLGDKRILSTFQQCGGERLSRILRLVAQGRLDPRPLITHRYPFNRVDEAFAALAAREPGLIKPIIHID